MRLKPEEVRIVNAVRSLGAEGQGKLVIQRGPAGTIQVHASWKDKPAPNQKQSAGGNKVDLRG